MTSFGMFDHRVHSDVEQPLPQPENAPQRLKTPQITTAKLQRSYRNFDSDSGSDSDGMAEHMQSRTLAASHAVREPEVLSVGEAATLDATLRDEMLLQIEEGQATLPPLVESEPDDVLSLSVPQPCTLEVVQTLPKYDVPEPIRPR